MKIPREQIERAILIIRGHRVMLDRELAALYQVKPIALRQSVRRNQDRFPPDFMFQLSSREARGLVSQSVIPSLRSLGGFLPYAFTEQGVAMLSSILRSEHAIGANIAIMRAFVRSRKDLAANTRLGVKLAELERKVGVHDDQIQGIFDAIRELMTPPAPPKQRIGFRSPEVDK